jgi:hypothetical protein
MTENVYAPTYDASAQNTFVTKVFGWMTFALLLTAVASIATAQIAPTLIADNPGLMIGLIVVELGLVMGLSFGLHAIPPAIATGMFILYSLLNGVTLSVIFLIYTSGSIAMTFFVTAGTFGAMTIYGLTTQRDLTSLGSLAFMGLIGVILGSVVNWFLASEALYWLVTYVGIAVFVGLTAYDAQKIKQIGAGMGTSRKGGQIQKAAVMGALSLYLDFVNLMLLLLRVLGRRR